MAVPSFGELGVTGTERERAQGLHGLVRTCSQVLFSDDDVRTVLLDSDSERATSYFDLERDLADRKRIIGHIEYLDLATRIAGGETVVYRAKATISEGLKMLIENLEMQRELKTGWARRSADFSASRDDYRELLQDTFDSSNVLLVLRMAQQSLSRALPVGVGSRSRVLHGDFKNACKPEVYASLSEAYKSSVSSRLLYTGIAEAKLRSLPYGRLFVLE